MHLLTSKLVKGWKLQASPSVCVPKPMVLPVEKPDCPKLCPEGLDSKNQLLFPFWWFLLVQTKMKSYLKILESDTHLRVRKEKKKRNYLCGDMENVLCCWVGLVTLTS